ncbi:heavy metal-associated domain-containing protein [Ichthyenterobacterium sp. W332]|uniref:Heavy metal-associated domain-containing protein n=1 Tax=Microcosmobacter mediterraneus TaxID=3075607 RepID=A0ABU2YNB7_9FLAO|nr:heavy metal-associated domain-containing protein [Ichthyenterobacterium sp. W332]MDT0559654.1 heavy metal-associated domain-containing protein [Ichthyenterobacterium sp. W332]
MKTFKNSVVIILATFFIVACKQSTPEVKTVDISSEKSSEIASIDPNATLAKAEFTINGMTCEMGCAKTIEKKMAKMEGVKSAKVDFGKKLAMVEYDEAKVTPNSLEEIVAKVSKVYEVENMKTVKSFSNEKACNDNDKKDCCANKTAEEIKACKEECKKKCNEAEEKA